MKKEFKIGKNKRNNCS
ncbi:hypothetical protein BG0647 [Borreliella bavariensis PBi]|uniref:Uncharacterized protein n=1 Tax=Borrelia garinii subsp. bavariensis (strain ATCC BAA-2496 / DSM 23469 / PBi) TaxID=290434 RepID=A0A7I6GWN6_BORGP|nr:hypothetical protein BG0647 [Borreliella bavariensis PBi]ABH01900.1 hypothetical protein BAPKO_0668 [Borreliella afzelii PKo]